MNITKHKKNSINLPYYLVAGALFVLLKYVFKTATTDDLYFLLKPTNELVELFISQVSTGYSADGFYYSELNIIIGKSCAGFNFWLLCMIMFLFSAISILRTNLQKIVAFPLVIFLAYLLTVFVNSSRIMGALFIQNSLGINNGWIHQAEGIFVYLFFLILFYLAFNFLISKLFIADAKPA